MVNPTSSLPTMNVQLAQHRAALIAARNIQYLDRVPDKYLALP
jgi:hypothetical protein